MEGESKTPPFY